ncbi:MAG TPA: type IVB secretion system protein IcmV [Gammaproteobacteria bacterium]|jgi:intracellular multiplication protein IcmV|nr:type IVB secretion system protein IcmV [Gammaproteobacteria bacterium]
MSLRSVFKISWRTFFNPRAWFGYDELKNTTVAIFGALSDLFTTAQPIYTETFEEAMNRLGLTEADIRAQMQAFRRYALLLFFCGMLTFAYTFYLLFAYAALLSFLLGIATSALFFVQAFKFHFWAFQLQERKLGLTFAAWKKHFLGEKR